MSALSVTLPKGCPETERGAELIASNERRSTGRTENRHKNGHVCWSVLNDSPMTNAFRVFYLAVQTIVAKMRLGTKREPEVFLPDWLRL